MEFTRKNQIPVKNEDKETNEEGAEEVQEGSKKEPSQVRNSDSPSLEEVQSSGNVEAVSADSLLGEVPTFSQHDPNAGETIEPEETEENGESQQKDKAGTVFDPSIHATDSEGNPVLNKDQTFRKKRGRRAGQTATSGYVDGNINQKEAAAVASTYFAAFKHVGSLVLGEEFKEHDKEEGEMVTKAIEAVCIEQDATGLTPSQMLLLALGSYTAPRLQTPTAKERLTLYWLKIRGFFSRNKKKKEEKAEATAQVESDYQVPQ